MSFTQGPFGCEETNFDDGVHESVSKITLKRYGHFIEYLQCNYIDGPHLVEGEGHGTPPTPHEIRDEFVLDYDDGEYLKYIRGTYNNQARIVSSLVFVTSKRTSCVFGRPEPSALDRYFSRNNAVEYYFPVVLAPESMVGGTNFEFGFPGFKIVGILGTEIGDVGFKALGVHLRAAVVPPVLEMHIDGALGIMQTWDDGVHINIVGLYGVYNEHGVWGMVFFYRNEDMGAVVGEKHGIFPIMQQTTPVHYFLAPAEIVTAVEGCFKEEEGPSRPSLKMIRFTTNLGLVIQMGAVQDETIPFLFREQNHKIVGLFSHENFGVYMMPVEAYEVYDAEI